MLSKLLKDCQGLQRIALCEYYEKENLFCLGDQFSTQLVVKDGNNTYKFSNTKGKLW